MFWKKHRPRCFWRCSKKAETSCSRCILAMFLLTILNELKNCSKFFEICDKLWQQCVFSNNLLTKILAWQAKLYQRGINIVGPNHFWRCGPRPKTSRKTSHFLLNDAMFQRCFEKNIDLDVFDDVWKNPKHCAHDASNDVNRPPLPSHLPSPPAQPQPLTPSPGTRVWLLLTHWGHSTVNNWHCHHHNEVMFWWSIYHINMFISGII